LTYVAQLYKWKRMLYVNDNNVHTDTLCCVILTLPILFYCFFGRNKVKEVPSFAHFILNRKEEREKKRTKYLHQSIKGRVTGTKSSKWTDYIWCG